MNLRVLILNRRVRALLAFALMGLVSPSLFAMKLFEFEDEINPAVSLGSFVAPEQTKEDIKTMLWDMGWAEGKRNRLSTFLMGTHEHQEANFKADVGKLLEAYKKHSPESGSFFYELAYLCAFLTDVLLISIALILGMLGLEYYLKFKKAKVVHA